MAIRPTPVPFTGTATLVAGNGVRLLANSTIYFANGTILANGTTSVPFEEYVQIRGSDMGNLAYVAAANSTVANLTPFAGGLAAYANSSLRIDPKWIAAATSTLPANANAIFVSVAANMTVNIAGC